MADNVYAVILAGGRGERFWPLSTARRPKQLLSLVGDSSLLAQAVDRLDGLIPPERVLVVTNQDLVDASREAAPRLPKENTVGEPVGRDTAAAVALSAALVKARNPDAAFCILTADHIMGDLDQFRATLSACLDYALEKDVLITIGIQPDSPSTGYGYIQAGNPIEDRDGIELLEVVQFVEKPNLRTATRYVETGQYFWNSGMFIWSVASIQKAFRTFRPQLADLIDTLTDAAGTPEFEATLAAEFDSLERISIDYAIMEKADNIVMAKGTFAWDDVGAWTALANHFDADPAGNIGAGSFEAVDARHNIIVAEDERLTAIIGVDNLVVVQAAGVTLVCHKDRAQDVKRMVQRLRDNPAYAKLL